MKEINERNTHLTVWDVCATKRLALYSTKMKARNRAKINMKLLVVKITKPQK